MMQVLRQLFESKLPDASLAWRGGDGKYGDLYVQRSWEMVAAVSGEMQSACAVDVLCTRGAEQVKVDLRTAILARMHKLQWPQSKVAMTCGVHQPEISKLISGTGQFSIDKLIGMLQALNERT